jgi:hypothetical protein
MERLLSRKIPKSRTESEKTIVLLPRVIEGGRERGVESEGFAKRMASVLSQLSFNLLVDIQSSTSWMQD